MHADGVLQYKFHYRFPLSLFHGTKDPQTAFTFYLICVSLHTDQ